jgi:hypothetical protein
MHPDLLSWIVTSLFEMDSIGGFLIGKAMLKSGLASLSLGP